MKIARDRNTQHGTKIQGLNIPSFAAGAITTGIFASIITPQKTLAYQKNALVFIAVFSMSSSIGAAAEEILATSEEAPEEEQYFNSSLREVTDTDLYGANPTFNEEI